MNVNSATHEIQSPQSSLPNDRPTSTLWSIPSEQWHAIPEEPTKKSSRVVDQTKLTLPDFFLEQVSTFLESDNQTIRDKT